MNSNGSLTNWEPAQALLSELLRYGSSWKSKELPFTQSIAGGAVVSVKARAWSLLAAREMSVGGWSEPPRRKKLREISVFPLVGGPNNQALQKVKTKVTFTEIK